MFLNNPYKDGNNGRINIQGPSKLGHLMMYDNPNFDVMTNSSGFKDAMKGNHEKNVLNEAFFSKENIRIIQNGIKVGVYERSHQRFVIGDQDEDNLKIIMRSIYLQNARNLPTSIRHQISELNNKVLEYCVHNVYGEAVSYMKYKHDVSTLAIPHAHPVSTGVKGSKTLELKRFM
jgi:hypothetical protein